MIKDKLIHILESNKSSNRLFFRTLLKEGIQDYILYFVYNHPVFKNLIFTGGTCLRKIYNLPRLSEDLDFDYQKDFDIERFCRDLADYFFKDLAEKDLRIRISNQQKTVFIKFPNLLTQLGLVKTSADPSLLFVRCDLSKENIGSFSTEVSPIYTPEFSFFALSYDLRTLFSNKIIAFVKREFFKGKEQSIAFKGRDLFDLVWFLQQTTRKGLQPNWERLKAGLKIKEKEEVERLVMNKVDKIEARDVRSDLLTFIEQENTIENFSENFRKIISQKLKVLMQ